jgi:hypothetical protein
MLKNSFTIFIAACFAMLSFDATAQYKWQGPTDGLWSAAANWLDVSTMATATVAPIGTTNIIFDAPADISINANGSVCNSILVTNNATVTMKAVGGSSSAGWGVTMNSQTSTGVKALQIDAGAKLEFRSTNTVAGGYFGPKPLSTTTILINGTLAFSSTSTLGNAKFDWGNSALGSPILVTVNGSYIHDVNSGTYVSPPTPSTITFAANSIFECKRATGFQVPAATWDPTSTIKISGIVGAPSIAWGGTTYTYGNFEYNNPGQTATVNFSMPTAATFKGNFKLTGVTTQKIRLSNTLNNMTVEGDFEVNNAAVSISNSATAAVSGISLNVFGNVKLTSGATLTLQETTTGAATVTKIKGNISVPTGCTLNTLSTSTTTLQTIELNGTTNQTISAAGTVSNAQLFTLKMNNAAGATLLTNLSVPQLDLSSAPGGVITTGANVLTISTPNTLLATLKGGSATCHVVGKMKRNTATTGNYIFPIGTGNSLRTVKVIPTATTATSYQAELALGTPPVGTLPVGIDHISPSESWDIAQPGGTVPAFIALSSDNGITVPAELAVLHFNSATTAWEDLGNDTGASTVGGLSTVTSLIPTTSFSPFAMGATAAPNNPLPVKLIRFEAVSAKNTVDLSWETAFERNASTFEVQYSVDGKTFTTFTTVQAKGNSDKNQKYNVSHHNFVNGANFYRLHIIDNDAKMEYSKVLSVNMNSNHNVKVYPTTASDAITIELNDDNETAFQIINNAGAIVMEGTVIAKQNISVSNLSQGVYFIKMANHETVSFVKQ